MEISEINGETSVLEETHEDVNSDAGTFGPSVLEESPGDDILSGNNETDSVVDGERFDEAEHSENESARESETEVVTETVVQTVEVLPDEPIAVYLVDEPVMDSGVTYAVNGDVYPGTISTTYTDYFAGIADKLHYDEHYVVFRQSQYVYRMMWGDTLSLSGSDFTGEALSYCSLTTNSGYNSDFMVEFGEDSLSLDAAGGFVYSDLGNYPSLTEGGSGLEFQTILFAIGFAIVYSVCHDIFDYIMEKIYR